MSTLCFYARYEDAAGDGVNGIAVTWDIEQITRSTGARVALVTGGATSIIIGRRGLYGYLLAGADLTLYDYVATAITASATPTVHEVAALWTLWSLSWHDVLSAALTVANSIGKRIVDYLDMAISDIPTLAEFFTINTGQTSATAVEGSVVKETADLVISLGAIAFPAGAIDYTYTVTDSLTGLPVEGAEVWFATDIAFANIVWKGDTDAFGVARDVNNDLPRLDAGTYYIRVQRAGYAAMDDTEVVS